MARLTPAQVRGARAMLGWSMLKLATAARVSIATVNLFEKDGPGSAAADAGDAMRDAFEAEGVHFIADEGHGPGMRLKRR